VAAAFAEEGTDDRWASATRLHLTERLKAALPTPASLRQIECRSSMCRVEIVQSDKEALRRFANTFFTDPAGPAWDGGAYVTYPQGMPEHDIPVVMFLTKKGTSPLPSPPG
jgi:hypothetical protein